MTRGKEEGESVVGGRRKEKGGGMKGEEGGTRENLTWCQTT